LKSQCDEARAKKSRVAETSNPLTMRRKQVRNPLE
jgi:hypothetical protein